MSDTKLQYVISVGPFTDHVLLNYHYELEPILREMFEAMTAIKALKKGKWVDLSFKLDEIYIEDTE